MSDKEKRSLAEVIKLHQDKMDLIEKQIELSTNLSKKEKERQLLNAEYAQNERTINRLLEVREEDLVEANELIDEYLKKQKEIEKSLKRQNQWREHHLKIIEETLAITKESFNYLLESDKAIKSTILNLGMSGAKADMMRSSFELSGQYVARLGGEIADIKTIMEGYANATGRARVMSEDTVKSVIAIGKGTGLGVEEATKLAAQFEFMSKDAKSTQNFVQGIVDRSELMGINTTNVLKEISTNFNKLSTFTFQQGTKAFAEMAISAERTRVSMATALNIAEANRGLESVVELSANLQVMGGRFAKLDPFHWLYTVRNEPEKINEMLSEMTRGIYTLRQTADGTFEKFISPADRDRLASVAKSLGVTNEEMFQIAQRSAELSLIQRDLSQLGLNEREKAIIEGVAQFNSNTGKMYVRIGDHMQDVTKLTSEQAKSFASEQKLLEERAKVAKTADEVLKSIINELKATLLPILRAINSTLIWVRQFTDGIGDWLNSINSPVWKAIAGGAILLGATALITSAKYWTKVLLGMQKTQYFGMGGDYGSRNIKSFTDKVDGNIIPEKQLNEGARRARNTGMVNRSRGIGMRNLSTGAGVGIGAAGIGVGIAAGAMGIAELAKAMKDMDVGKIMAMNVSLLILGGTMVGLGIAGKTAGVGMIKFGAGVALVGAGIGIAAAGIGFMAKGFASMVESTRGGDLLTIASGISAIAGATMRFANPLNLLGLGTLTATLAVISGTNLAAAHAAKNIENMAIAMSGTKEDFLAVEKAVNAINTMDRKNANIFSNLANIMSQPLKVQFDESSVNLKNDITLDIDRSTFMHKIFDSKLAVQLIERQRIGKR